MGDLAKYSCSGGSSRSRPKSVTSGSRTSGGSPQKRTSSGAPLPRMCATTMPSIRPEGVEAGVFRSASRSTHTRLDRKSTRLNSSHRCISYAVFCLKKKKKNYKHKNKEFITTVNIKKYFIDIIL